MGWLEGRTSQARLLPHAPPTPQPRPVFLHGMWRSGSTFAWSRFRDAPGTHCYFEPLYSGLARLTPERVGGEGWREAISGNRHPEMARPYFDEYLPLIHGRGVRGYDRRLAFHDFALEPHASVPGLQAYVSGLIDHAAGLKRVPVLGFNRTNLRIAWLKAQFRSYDVYVERGPRSIWASYVEHSRRGNYSYFNNLFRILELNGRHPLFAALAERYPLRRGGGLLVKPKHYYPDVADALSETASYELVAYMWLIGLMHGLSTCELVIDTGLAERPWYAPAIESRLGRETGLGVSFAGLRRVRPTVSPAAADAVERRVATLLPAASGGFFDFSRIGRRLHELAPETAALVGEVVAGAAERRAA